MGGLVRIWLARAENLTLIFAISDESADSLTHIFQTGINLSGAVADPAGVAIYGHLSVSRICQVVSPDVDKQGKPGLIRTGGETADAEGLNREYYPSKCLSGQEKNCCLDYNQAMSTFQQQSDFDTGLVLQEARPKLKRPPMYKVVLLNDDYTPMEFVVHILQDIFAMNVEKATQIMLHVHTRGVGVCGVFTRDIAETKVAQVNQVARENQHPLKCSMEKA